MRKVPTIENAISYQLKFLILRPLRYSIFCVIVFLFFTSYKTSAQNQWDGDNSVGDFTNCDNWYSNLCPVSWNSGNDLRFEYKNNNSQTSIYQNIGWKDVQSIIYAATFGAGIPLDGNGSGFNFWYKIQNFSTYPQVLNIPLSGKGLIIELDPTNADLTINNTIYNDKNLNYEVYGPNSKVLYLNGQLVGNSSVSLKILEYSKVAIGYSNSTGSFGGGVTINTGELWFQSGSAINGGTINVGSFGNLAKLYINASSGGTTVDNNINVIANSTSIIGGLNSSGINTYTGLITMNNSLTLETWSGGTVDFSGDISGNYPVTISRVSGSGNAIVKYITTSKSYTGTTTIGNGATLVLDTPSALSSLNDIVLTSGGVLQISANQTIRNLDVPTGSTLDVDAAETLTITGTWSGGGTIINNGKIVLTGPSTFPGSGTTVSAMNDLTINNPGGVALDNSLTVNGTLTLSSGTLNIGGNTLTMGNTSPAISGVFSASCMIVANGSGEVRKAGTTVTQASYTFPIGDNTITTEYSPITLTFSGGTYNGYSGVKVTNAQHPKDKSTDNYLIRYWSVTQSGYTGPVSISATYVPADIFGIEGKATSAQYTGSYPWIKYSSLGSDILTAGNVPSFTSADFSGVANPTVSVTPGPLVSVCQNDTPPTLSATATGTPIITYLWSPGGETTPSITPSTATEGTTNYTVTVTDGNGLTATATVAVTVNAKPAPSAIYHD